jgi:hypothetical protein
VRRFLNEWYREAMLFAMMIELVLLAYIAYRAH